MPINLLCRDDTELADVDGVLRELMGTHVRVPDTLAEVASVTVCADRVQGLGGDFVDVFPASETSMAILIGDLFGHRAELARMAVGIKLLVRRLVEVHNGLGEILERASGLITNAMPELFASAFLGIVDLSTGKMTYGCAGHEPGVILRRHETESLKVGGTLLGVDPSLHYEEYEADISGAVLALFTDGLTEAIIGPERTRLGVDQLVTILRDRLQLSPTMKELANSVVRGIVEGGYVEVPDDATLLLVRPIS